MNAPALTGEAHDVILRDGTTLRLRPPQRGDVDALMAFFSGLSERSFYLRFHGAPQIGPRLVEPFLDPDWDDRGSYVGAVAGADGVDRIVALASYARLREAATAEVAFAVADELQGHGAGTRLLEQLAERAHGVGIERFVAEVMPENSAMLRVFEDAGFDVERELEGGTLEVRFDIGPTPGYLARVDERDHLAVVRSLRPFFAPTSVAVIGASPRRGSIGGELFRNILRGDFTGAAFPVNRAGEPVAGVTGHRSLEEIPTDVDLVVICLPGERVLEAAGAALRAGVRAICVISAGFAETGRAGAERQEQLLALVRAHGARLVGPNCLGLAVAAPRLNATFGPKAIPSGNVAFSSQSGALGLALLERATERGLGLSAFVSVGNKADVSSNDLLEYWEDDPDTDVVMLYLESFGNPRRFGRIARRVARKKPILAMKSGTTRTGARAATSHTAALAGSEAAVDALFTEAGVIRARTLAELIDAAVLLSSQPLPKGRRVAIVTNAGGLGILCADACEGAGLELPALERRTELALAGVLPREASVANPVDMLGSATASTYEQVVPHLLADNRVDALIVVFVPPVMAGADEVAEAVERAIEAAGAEGKPVLAVMISEGGIPGVLLEEPRRVAAFSDPDAAAQALGLAARRAEWLRRPAGTVPEIDGIDRAQAEQLVAEELASSTDVWLRPAQTRRLLDAYGIPLVDERVATSPEDAAAAAEELGFPVAVKTAVPGAHKTETGGVVLGLSGPEEVVRAATGIGGPVIVQRMVSGGVELLAGLTQDPVFGPLVAFGPGGTFAELIGEAEFRIAPLTDMDASELVTRGKGGKLVAGYRGSPPADQASLTDLLQRLSRLGEDLPEVAELDLNPVIASPDGCVAVDARVRLRPSQRTLRSKTW
ncbi:MAG TPA: GNAT family N-acetyltransferase [Gaiellaceae bacterium]